MSKYETVEIIGNFETRGGRILRFLKPRKARHHVFCGSRFYEYSIGFDSAPWKVNYRVDIKHPVLGLCKNGDSRIYHTYGLFETLDGAKQWIHSMLDSFDKEANNGTAK